MRGPELALIGLGGMGKGIGLCLLDEGFSLRVHNRTPERAKPLVDAGATLAESAADAVAGVGVVILCLSDEAAVEEVLFGPRAPGFDAGTLLVDTSTVSPTYARDATRRLAERGIGRLEACMVGNPQMARVGWLRVFTAGNPRDAERVADILDVLGQEVRHIGADGMACVLKLAFNMLLAAQTAGLAEAVAYGTGAGIDREVLLHTLVGDGSGLSSPLLAFRADFMIRGHYEPAAFRSSLMAKDLHLAMREGAELGLALPLTGSAAEQFDSVIKAGDGDKDAAAILELRQRR
ncbi:NAD(P)-dependent oxidoreductase [Nonomuraea sp. NPDC059007]|uniref:NAD(P)-dependent oxidoreductase n=1 Tax=Nonomuraea sp. NPDC059007 TaxID=3346692 RepID=UPI003678C70A